MAYDPAYQLSAEQLKNLIEDSPFLSRFSYDLSMSNDNGLVTRLPFADRLIGNAIIKAIHGGVVASFLENTAWMEVSARLGVDISISPFTTTNDYLRPTENHDLFGQAHVVKWGKRSVSVVATAWQNNPDKPVSQASCHFLISKKS
ncbi:PaaI family thioesterase [Alphaproteobacteria bacterium]|nr:PaaI family thioesterase [Alphaproteobacteria bacterium]